MQPLIITCVVIVIIIVLASSLLKTPKVKGTIGEHKARRKMGKAEDDVQYVINDALFDTGSESCQIDRIVPSHTKLQRYYLLLAKELSNASVKEKTIQTVSGKRSATSYRNKGSYRVKFC